MDTITDNYIDIHSHVIYGIDDGSKNLESSIEILKEYEKMGFTKIITTPHYIENTKYNYDNLQKNKILNELKKEIKKNKINIELYVGNEIFIARNIEELLELKKVSALNNSNYILIELPLEKTIDNLDDIIFSLRETNIIPILAHPERYECIQDNINYLDKLIDSGMLIQINYGSLLGIYGSKAKKTAKKLLKNKKVNFIGTDIHYPNSPIFNKMGKIRKKIIKLIGQEEANKIMYENANRILFNK